MGLHQGQSATALATGAWQHGNATRRDQFTPSGTGAFDFGLGNPAVPPARGVLFSDSNVVKGVGPVDPLDVLYDCGQDNVIHGMIVMTCSSATASGQRGQVVLPNKRPKGLTFGK